MYKRIISVVASFMFLFVASPAFAQTDYSITLQQLVVEPDAALQIDEQVIVTIGDTYVYQIQIQPDAPSFTMHADGKKLAYSYDKTSGIITFNHVSRVTQLLWDTDGEQLVAILHSDNLPNLPMPKPDPQPEPKPNENAPLRITFYTGNKISTMNDYMKRDVTVVTRQGKRYGVVTTLKPDWVKSFKIRYNGDLMAPQSEDKNGVRHYYIPYELFKKPQQVNVHVVILAINYNNTYDVTMRTANATLPSQPQPSEPVKPTPPPPNAIENNAPPVTKPASNEPLYVMPKVMRVQPIAPYTAKTAEVIEEALAEAPPLAFERIEDDLVNESEEVTAYVEEAITPIVAPPVTSWKTYAQFSLISVVFIISGTLIVLRMRKRVREKT